MKLGNLNDSRNYTFRRRNNYVPLIIAVVVMLLAVFGIWQLVLSPLFHGGTTTASAPNSMPPTADIQNLAVQPTAGSTPVITAQVVDAEKGSPINDVTLSVNQVVVTHSDANGKMMLYQTIPAGISTLSLNAPGYREMTITPDALTGSTPIQLQPMAVQGTVLDAITLKPLAGKTVSMGDITAQTAKDGTFRLEGIANSGTVKVEGRGYFASSVDLAANGTWPSLQVALYPNLMHMQVKDTDGTPIKHGEVRIVDASGADVTDAGTGNPVSVSLDDSGSFALSDIPTDGAIHIRAPGYKIQSVAAKDLADGKTISLPKFIAKAVYIPGIFATAAYHDDPDNGYKWFLKLADNTEINTFVISIKDDDTGTLFYPSKIPLVSQLKLENSNQMDVAKVIKEAHAHGVYVAARYVVFRDPAVANARPDWAIKSKATGKAWQDQLGLKWPNELVPQVQQYNIDLAKELASLGFDEVQFDYVRFPTDGNIADGDWGTPLNQTIREQTIHKFVSAAHEYLKTTDTFLSIDVFGITPWRDDDNNIGQNYSILVNDTDYICPMIYPSHFSPGDDGFDNPTAHPYEMIADSTIHANKKGVNAYSKYRPWLQDFVFKKPYYGAAEVRTQIKAAEENGSWGWILWNASGNYSTDALVHKK